LDFAAAVSRRAREPPPAFRCKRLRFVGLFGSPEHGLRRSFSQRERDRGTTGAARDFTPWPLLFDQQSYSIFKLGMAACKSSIVISRTARFALVRKAAAFDGHAE